MGGNNEQKRTFLEEFFQLCSKLNSQLAFDGVMFEQGQNILRKCSRFSVASKTRAQSREMGQQLASESQKRDRGGEGVRPTVNAHWFQIFHEPRFQLRVSLRVVNHQRALTSATNGSDCGRKCENV